MGKYPKTSAVGFTNHQQKKAGNLLPTLNHRLKNHLKFCFLFWV